MTRMRKRINTYSVFVTKRAGKRSLRRPSRRRAYNLKEDLKEIRREDLYWTNLAQGKVR